MVLWREMVSGEWPFANWWASTHWGSCEEARDERWSPAVQLARKPCVHFIAQPVCIPVDHAALFSFVPLWRYSMWDVPLNVPTLAEAETAFKLLLGNSWQQFRNAFPYMSYSSTHFWIFFIRFIPDTQWAAGDEQLSKTLYNTAQISQNLLLPEAWLDLQHIWMGAKTRQPQGCGH